MIAYRSGRIDFEACAPAKVSEQFDLFGEPEPVFARDDSEGTFPVLFTYWGPRVWEFKNAFTPHGTVFLAGRGHSGPWVPTATVRHS